MGRGGLYSGFEAYRVVTAEDIRRALQIGIVSLDTNVLLSLYRYNEKTVDDLRGCPEFRGTSGAGR
jgi:hypothetical protein